MKNKLISIIVPVYNRENYLERCIKSIVEQTYKELEIILVDDGSTDGSLNICKKWVKIDSRIKVIEKENGGVSSARNAGIDAANGEYIGFVDSDDYIEPEMYEKLVAPFFKLGNDKIQMTSCGVFKGKKFVIDKDTVFDKKDAYILMFNYKPHFKAYTVNKLYLTKIIKQINLNFVERLTFGEDARFNFDYFKYIDHFCAVSYCGYNYVVNDSSAVVKVSKNSNRWASADLPQYFIDNAPSSDILKYILNWSVPHYRNIIYEYYMGFSNEKTYNYIKKEIKQHEKQYLNNDTLSKKDKAFIIAICHFGTIYKIYKKHKTNKR